MWDRGLVQFYGDHLMSLCISSWVIVSCVTLFLEGFGYSPLHPGLWFYPLCVVAATLLVSLLTAIFGWVAFGIVKRYRLFQERKEARLALAELDRTDHGAIFAGMSLARCSCGIYHAGDHYHVSPYVIIGASVFENAIVKYRERNNEILEKVSAKYRGKSNQARSGGYSIRSSS